MPIGGRVMKCVIGLGRLRKSQSKSMGLRPAGYLWLIVLAGSLTPIGGCAGVPIVLPGFYPGFYDAHAFSEKITVQSVPGEATVNVKTGSGNVVGSGMTPFQVRVPCGDSAVITVSAPGYEPQSVTDPVQSSGGLFATPPPPGHGCHEKDIVDVILHKSQTNGTPGERVVKLLSDAAVLKAPKQSAKKISEVHQGRYVRVTGSAPGYFRIVMRSGLVGFIPTSAVEAASGNEQQDRVSASQETQGASVQQTQQAANQQAHSEAPEEQQIEQQRREIEELQ